MRNLASEIVERLRATIGNGPYALHEPTLSELDELAVVSCIRSGFVSSVGPEVSQFERQLEGLTGCKHAVAVVNGTAALHVALLLAGVQPGDEVIVPALSFIATANAVSYCQAVPHFVDIEHRTLGIDSEALRHWLRDIAHISDGRFVNRLTGRKISALVPMHVFGNPCEIEALSEVASEFGLAMVEDAAESIGSRRHGKHTGTTGLLGAVSFNGNKVITTGGGGAILTNDQRLADRALHLTTTAKLPHPWRYVHDEVGFNYRMPNLNAALGCAQLAQLDDFVASKRRLAAKYGEAFSDLGSVAVLREAPGSSSNYWLQTLILSQEGAKQRDSILENATRAGFGCRPAWDLLTRLKPYRFCPSAPLPIAQDLERRIINLPSGAGLA